MIDYILNIKKRLQDISKLGDPLEKLNKVMKWEPFRKLLENIIPRKNKTSNGGRPSYDHILMFKIIVIQTLYNISDEQTEFQIKDRLSFMRFLNLSLTDKVPDAKTIWLFKEKLGKDNGIEELFNEFENTLIQSGFYAKSGQIIDASIIKTPIRRTGRKNDELIKKGKHPENWHTWSKSKKAQTDMDARWTKKNKKSFFGYKNHINIDKKYRFIRKWDVSSASLHDSQAFKNVYIYEKKLPVYADAAYRSKKIENIIKNNGNKNKIQFKKNPNKKLPLHKSLINKMFSIGRVVVEHVFAKQKTHMNFFIRSIGLKRAKLKTGLANLVFNFTRFEFLNRNL